MAAAGGGELTPPSVAFLAGATWMWWRLITLNAVLAIACLAFAVGIVRTFQMKQPMPEAASRAGGGSSRPVPAEAGQPDVAEYAVIIAQNLFSPSRGATIVAAVSAPKPYLHGVVIDGTRSRAYLEDPVGNRVSGYSVGDEVAGGRIQRIASDRVLIMRPEGIMEVLLQDPSKPRPVATAAVAPPLTTGPAQMALAPPESPVTNQPSPFPPQPGRRALGQGRPGTE